MDITWDLIGQTILFAAVISIVLGIGKVVATAFLSRSHIVRRKLKKEEIEKVLQVVVPEFTDALIEALVGFIILVAFIVFGDLDASSFSIMVEFTAMVGVLFLIIAVFVRFFLEAKTS